MSVNDEVVTILFLFWRSLSLSNEEELYFDSIEAITGITGYPTCETQINYD